MDNVFWTVPVEQIACVNVTGMVVPPDVPPAAAGSLKPVAPAFKDVKESSWMRNYAQAGRRRRPSVLERTFGFGNSIHS